MQMDYIYKKTTIFIPVIGKKCTLLAQCIKKYSICYMICYKFRNDLVYLHSHS